MNQTAEPSGQASSRSGQSWADEAEQRVLDEALRLASKTGWNNGLVSRALAAAGLSDAVRLVGHCDDMPAAYLLADLAILPTIVPESFGRAAVEPQAMGRPVIASDQGGTAETVINGTTGWLVPPGNAEAWAEALRFAIDLGPGKRGEMGQAGANRVRQLYSVDAMCAATLSAYERVLEARA